jgi:hypothetical protein
MQPRRIVLRDVGVAQRSGCDGSRLLNETMVRYGQIDAHRIEAAPRYCIDLPEIGVARCAGMIGLVEAKEPPVHR